MSSPTNVDRAHEDRSRLDPISRNVVRLIALCLALILITAACSSGAATETNALPTLESSTSTPKETTNGSTSETDDGGGAAVGEGDEGEDDENTAPDEDVDPEIAMAEYEKCMSDHGVDMDFSGSSDGASIQTLEEVPADAVDENGVIADGAFGEDFEAAMEECDPILEEAFGSFEMTPEQEAEMADEMLEMQRCLSDEGFEIDMTGNSFALDQDIDFEAFEAAMSACGDGIQVIG